eukprot:CAMPEP_0115346758 /NCGR_PEP_ID=MMETSP0270-20121206/94519_1 /TAXON_ID=71861 /ORGANISM="Scrippsiella trochoidea, Strain CCMP3099" /LENGTH=1013 /DNA_ID=CAMNT_0002768637 /DNA_START=67 /DNA_END=3105 /DNA_ORIENTATION=-
MPGAMVGARLASILTAALALATLPLPAEGLVVVPLVGGTHDSRRQRSTTIAATPARPGAGNSSDVGRFGKNGAGSGGGPARVKAPALVAQLPVAAQPQPLRFRPRATDALVTTAPPSSLPPKKVPPAAIVGGDGGGSGGGGGASVNGAVSMVTLACVVVLALECVAVHAALAVARASDELEGRTRPSWFADACFAATRGAVYPPMLCTLFIACDMYSQVAAEVAEGSGVVPQAQGASRWRRHFMIVSTVGMTLQFLVVLVLPLVTQEVLSPRSAEEDEGIEDSTARRRKREKGIKAGGECDVHPVLDGHVFSRLDHQGWIWGLQVCSMAAMYGGAAGVLTGTWQTARALGMGTATAPACVSTCVLSVPYFSIFLALWILRHITAPSEDSPSSGSDTQSAQDLQLALKEHGEREKEAAGLSVGERLVQGALAASDTMRKAPMVALLFLAVTIRAGHLGASPASKIHWVVGATPMPLAVAGYLCLEAFCAGVAGAVGEADVDAPRGTHVYTTIAALQAPKLLVAIFVYQQLLPVALSIPFMEPEASTLAAEEVPLSAALRAVLLLEALYFAVHVGQWLAFFAQDLCELDCKRVRNTLLNVGVANRFLPAVCTLFIITEFRVLQLTENMGVVPAWAQECMYVTVFATFVQAICNFLAPLLLETSIEVDEDGKPEYHLQPWFLASVVAMVNHAALLALSIGVLAMSIVHFTITRETAMRDKEEPLDHKRVLRMLIVTLVITLIASLLSSGRALGMAIKFGVESADRLVIGTDIDVKRVYVKPLKGKVRIQGLRVCNPGDTSGANESSSTQWRSECILKVDELVLDIDMLKLVTSLGKQFEIEEIVLHGAHAYMEKPSLKGTSNIRLVVDFIGKGSATDESSPSSMSRTFTRAMSKHASQEMPKTTEQGKEEQDSGIEVRIRKVSIEDIGATAIPPPHFGSGFAVQLGDINFEDLSERMKNKSGAVKDVVAIVLNTILSTVAANTHAALAKRMMSGGDDDSPTRRGTMAALADVGRSW